MLSPAIIVRELVKILLELIFKQTYIPTQAFQINIMKKRPAFINDGNLKKKKLSWCHRTLLSALTLKIFKLLEQCFHDRQLKAETSIFLLYFSNRKEKELIKVAALSFQLLPALYSVSNSPITNSYCVIHIPNLYIRSQRMLYFCQSGFPRQPPQTN